MRQRLGDVEATAEAALQLALELVQRAGLADDDELRRRLVEPREQVADLVDRQAWKSAYARASVRHLRDVQLVVHVAVEVEPAGHRGDRLARGLERDRHVAEEPARRVGDDGALVADDEPVEPELRRDSASPTGTSGR